MNGFEVYKLYVAIKKHFHTRAYDFFKYNGKVKNITPQSYEKRRDRAFFQKLGRYRDPKMMLVYNLVENDRWIGEICINEEALEIYRRHKKINQSLRYEFQKELRQFEDLKELISAENDTHPLIIRKFMESKVSLETLVIVVDVLRPISYWQRKFPNDIILEPIIHRVNKFKNFMNYDRDTMKTILKDALK